MTHIPPLGAFLKGTLEYVHPTLADKTLAYVCPLCQSDVIVRQGQSRKWHFSHKADSECTYFAHPNESQLHFAAKMTLQNLLKRHIPLIITRPCGTCKQEEDSEITTDETSEIVCEYRFDTGIADVAWLSTGEVVEVICLFEIRHTHSQCDRPEPWFEINAAQVMENFNTDAVRLTCIRKVNCEPCEAIHKVINDKLRQKHAEEVAAAAAAVEKALKEAAVEKALKEAAVEKALKEAAAVEKALKAAAAAKARSLKTDPLDLYVIDWEGEDLSNDNGDLSDSEDDVREAKCSVKFAIRAYCRSKTDEAVVVHINGFCPYFFIEIPGTWTELKVKIFVTELRKKVKPFFADTLIRWNMVRAKPLYGFTATDQFLYLKMEFSCLTGFNQYKYVFKNKIRLPGISNGSPVYYKQFESNIPPLLRFLHVHSLKAVGWLTISNYISSSSGLEMHLAKGTIASSDVGYTPKIITMAFDIECDSSHGDFPVAKKDYQKLAQDIISEYLNTRIGDKKKPRTAAEMEPIIATFLKYAFDPFYTNNNIVGLPGVALADVKAIFAHAPLFKEGAALLGVLSSGADGPRVNEFMSLHFPLPGIDYTVTHTGEQLVLEYNRLIASNNPAFKTSPIESINLLLTLVFDPLYTNFNINSVYLWEGVGKPKTATLLKILPEIKALCEAAYSIKIKESKLVPDKAKGAKKVTIADQISLLTKLFNDALPRVAGDPIIQIGSTFKKQGSSDCYLKHIICLDTCEPIMTKTLIDFEHGDITLPEKDLQEEAKKLQVPPSEVYQRKRELQYETDQAEVIVETYATEREVLLAWQRLVKKTDPDLVVGYNIFGFDFKYIYDRATALGIQDEFCQLGRVENRPSELIEQKLASAALGDNLLYYISMHGRILIDLYNVVQKLASLASYKLDDVCREFLYKNKVDITPAQIFTKQKGSPADRRMIAEYCLIDCILCNRLMDKLEILANNTGMAQVCSVPLSYLFLRGQGVKLLSYVAKECRLAGLLLPVLEMGETPDESSYEGAIVLEPEKNIHMKPVGVLDFNSLYPSCMISENLTFEDFIGSIVISVGESQDFRGKLITANPYEKKLLDGELPGWDYVDICYDNYTEVPISAGRKTMVKRVSGHTICRFAQHPNGEKGLVPRILMNLLDSRKATRKKQATFPKGSFEYNIYEGLQLAYKVTANSLYGIIGANTSKIKLKEIAACTTAVGRGLIYKTANFIKENYAGSSIVYGDTDSVFIKFDCRDEAGNELTGLPAIFKSMELCIEAAGRVNLLMKKPHNIEFEKVICPFVLISKKRYLGNYYTTMGSPKYSVKSMGVVTKRRDNANIVKYVFSGMIDIIMKGNPIQVAIEFVQDACRKVLAGEFPMDMFIITKTLRSYYALPESVAHNVLAQRIGKRDPGNKPRANDRIAYAYIENPGVKTQGERIETPDFIVKNKLKLDYPHYITNQIAKPVIQIFELAGKGEKIFDNLLQDYIYKRDGIRRITDFGFSCISIKSRTAAITFTPLSSDDEDSSEED
jgi:DNA polymerase elongation subunit (family B)